MEAAGRGPGGSGSATAMLLEEAVRLARPRWLASRGSVLTLHPGRLSRPAVRSGDILSLYPSGS